MNRELLQQFLTILENTNRDLTRISHDIANIFRAVKVELAKPESTNNESLSAEPVAWVDNLNRATPHCVTDLKYCSIHQHQMGEHLNYIPLYTSPPQLKRVLLSNEDITLFTSKYYEIGHLTEIPKFIRAIEAKVYEKLGIE